MIVKIDLTTICGTDLHILKGDVPAVTEGRILGHEAVGTVLEVGAAVTTLKQGDRVLVPAITSCGRCGPCQRGMAAHCQGAGGIGWIFGHLINGLQAEYARVPFAETSVHVVPEGVGDEQVLFLADILPTGYEIGVQNGGVKPGDAIAVVGAGPVGLAAMMTAEIAGAARIIAVDHDHDRPRQRVHDPDAAQARPRRTYRGRKTRHPPLCARGNREGIRRLRRRRPTRRPQSSADGLASRESLAPEAAPRCGARPTAR
ncbi:MAG TPA: alcohol dehydrogenase catalytic domain-containing protein [Solirubrobacteraceae bacterium]|nr:alcohol dehydrogenase catalytic domain-containing protein [Solirubrobacteraceae bacterium]